MFDNPYKEEIKNLLNNKYGYTELRGFIHHKAMYLRSCAFISLAHWLNANPDFVDDGLLEELIEMASDPSPKIDTELPINYVTMRMLIFGCIEDILGEKAQPIIQEIVSQLNFSKGQQSLLELFLKDRKRHGWTRKA